MPHAVVSVCPRSIPESEIGSNLAASRSTRRLRRGESGRILAEESALARCSTLDELDNDCSSAQPTRHPRVAVLCGARGVLSFSYAFPIRARDTALAAGDRVAGSSRRDPVAGLRIHWVASVH